jgi:hypothetical protein
VRAGGVESGLDGEVSAADCVGKGTIPPAVRAVDIGAAAEKELNCVQVAGCCGDVQSAALVVVSGIDRDSRLDEGGKLRQAAFGCEVAKLLLKLRFARCRKACAVVVEELDNLRVSIEDCLFYWLIAPSIFG